MDTMQKVYQDAQAACGLKVGDWVKVARKASDCEGGWYAAWVTPMDNTVGKYGRVISIRGNDGIGVRFSEPLNDWWNHPYFVLEKVEKPVHEFKPFDKVLVRDDNDSTWVCDFYSNVHADCGFICVGELWQQCIPYEGNEHLLGTTDSPEE